MNIFGQKETAVIEPEPTATDVLRQRALNCVKRLEYARIASDLGTSPEKFRDFAEGQVNLPVEILQKMVKSFFNSAEFDPVADKLVATGPAPTTLPGPGYPSPFIPSAASYPPPASNSRERPMLTGGPQAKPYKKPAGWA
jgi:hypothetical protein